MMMMMSSRGQPKGEVMLALMKAVRHQGCLLSAEEAASRSKGLEQQAGAVTAPAVALSAPGSSRWVGCCTCWYGLDQLDCRVDLSVQGRRYRRCVQRVSQLISQVSCRLLNCIDEHCVTC